MLLFWLQLQNNISQKYLRKNKSCFVLLYEYYRYQKNPQKEIILEEFKFTHAKQNYIIWKKNVHVVIMHCTDSVNHFYFFGAILLSYAMIIFFNIMLTCINPLKMNLILNFLISQSSLEVKITLMNIIIIELYTAASFLFIYNLPESIYAVMF